MRAAAVAASIYQLEIRLSDGPVLRADMPLRGASVGAADTCTVRIEDPRLPARWLEVGIERDNVTFTPLDGSHAEGPTVRIGHWCILSAGHVRVVPAARTTYQTAVLDRRLDGLFETAASKDWTEPYLELVDHEPATRFRVPVGRPTLIGRKKAECDIALADAQGQVSRQHAILEWNDEQPTLRDRSTNGTFWKRPAECPDFRGIVRTQPLCDGDLLQIGPWTLRFCWPQAALADRLATVSDTRQPSPALPRTTTPTGSINWLFLSAATLAALCLAAIAWLAAG